MVKLNKHLLEHRDWVTEISSMAMSPCNPFPRIPSMTNYSKKNFVFSLNLQLMTHTSILSANYEDAYLNKP